VARRNNTGDSRNSTLAADGVAVRLAGNGVAVTSDFEIRLQRLFDEATLQRTRYHAVADSLRATMDAIFQGRTALKPGSRDPKSNTQGDLLKPLSNREKEILRLIAEGKSTKEIGHVLNIAFKTVVCHRTHLLKKLNCHESATLVRLACRAGLVD
jgi:DNA-binding NarL/FixJ family response regulator